MGCFSFYGAKSEFHLKKFKHTCQFQIRGFRPKIFFLGDNIYVFRCQGHEEKSCRILQLCIAKGQIHCAEKQLVQWNVYSWLVFNSRQHPASHTLDVTKTKFETTKKPNLDYKNDKYLKGRKSNFRFPVSPRIAVLKI